MFCNTRAIVLGSVKYSDNNLLLHAYTEETGRTTYVINGIKSRRCVAKPALLAPLSIIEIEAEHHPKRDIQRIKESKIVFSSCNISANPVRNSIAHLLAEVLQHCLRETECNAPLFNFLVNSILRLETMEEGIANFHLVFMLNLSAYLGFYPNYDNKAANTFFDQMNGCFLYDKPLHRHFLPIEESNLLKDFLINGCETACTRTQRNRLLDELLDYYRLHLTHFGEIKSCAVLKVLF
ncbi:DNA repair protein RecO [Bacteroidia bacterium]|nr:DNA repair protein RecO [Bacteroidia bacterium]